MSFSGSWNSPCGDTASSGRWLTRVWGESFHDGAMKLRKKPPAAGVFLLLCAVGSSWSHRTLTFLFPIFWSPHRACSCGKRRGAAPANSRIQLFITPLCRPSACPPAASQACRHCVFPSPGSPRSSGWRTDKLTVAMQHGMRPNRDQPRALAERGVAGDWDRWGRAAQSRWQGSLELDTELRRSRDRTDGTACAKTWAKKVHSVSYEWMLVWRALFLFTFPHPDELWQGDGTSLATEIWAEVTPIHFQTEMHGLRASVLFL